MIRTVVIFYAFINVALISAFPKPAEIDGKGNDKLIVKEQLYKLFT